MTALLHEVRETPEVMEQYGDLAATHECVCSVDFAKYDRALLRACLRVVAERVRAKHNEGASLWFDTCADFIERMGDE